jgi:hypothetical protein
MIKTEIEEKRNRAEMIGPVSRWWCKYGEEWSLHTQPDVEADENTPCYSFETLLNS